MSLQDTIRANANTLSKQGKGLFESTDNASTSAGRLSNPTNPLSSSMLGTNPDQAKMAGTPANRDSATKDTVEGLSLRDTLRREQASTEKTTAEEEAKKRAGQLGVFSKEMEDRVHNLVVAKGNAAGNVKITPKIDVAKLKTAYPALDDTKAANLGSSIEGLIGGTIPASDIPARVKDIASVLGLAAPLAGDEAGLKNFMDKVGAELKHVMPEEAATIEEAATKAVDDYAKLTVSDLWAEGGTEATKLLGNPAQLAESLGISLDALNKMSLSQLRGAMDEAGSKDFSRIKELQTRAADPYTSTSERNAIIRELRTLGASGVRSNEKDYSRYTEAVKKGDRVTFQGKDMSLEEAMSDASVSSWTHAYLTGDDTVRAALAGENPGLAKFVESNRKVLSEATSKVSDAIKDQAKLTQDALNLKASLGVSDATMEALFPGYNKLGAIAAPEQKALMDNIDRMPKGLVSYIDGQMASGDMKPDDARFLLKQDPDILNSLSSNPAKMSEWLDYQRDFENRANDPNELMKIAGLDPATINQDLEDYWRDIHIQGVADNPELHTIMDTIDHNHDGITDSSFDLKTVLSKIVHDRIVAPENKDATFQAPNLRDVLSKVKDTATEALTTASRAKTAADKKVMDSYTGKMDEVKRLQAGIQDLLNRQRGEGNASTRRTMESELATARGQIKVILDELGIKYSGKDLDGTDWSQAPSNVQSSSGIGISMVPRSGEEGKPGPAVPPATPPPRPAAKQSPTKKSEITGKTGRKTYEK